MKSIYLIVFFLFSFATISSATDSLFQKGLEEIYHENYAEAQLNLEKTVLTHPSFSSFYNLGIAAGKLEDWSKAKWAFESALKYLPLNGDAQFNAEFATHQLSENQEWSHPYSWIKRIILGFGVNAWLIVTILSSLLLGLIVFFATSQYQTQKTLNKWCMRLIFPAILFFIIAISGVYITNNHFTKEQFAIIKNDQAKLYISPNGLKIQQEINLGNRFIIVDYFDEDTWVQIQSQDNQMFWVKKNEIYIY